MHLTERTGASSGIGEACARLFVESQAKVIMTARRTSRLDEIKLELLAAHPRARIHLAALDVADKKQVEKVVNELPDEFRSVDVLINNAGLALGLEHVADVSDDVIDRTIDTNVKGLLYVTRSILMNMKQRQSGHIINIGSIAGTEVYPGGGVYCASKHAVHAITKTLRIELHDSPLRVTEINPVRFQGDKERASRAYENTTPLTPADIADLVVFAASRPPHVQVADILVTPVCQGSVLHISRNVKLQ